MRSPRLVARHLHLSLLAAAHRRPSPCRFPPPRHDHTLSSHQLLSRGSWPLTRHLRRPESSISSVRRAVPQQPPRRRRTSAQRQTGASSSLALLRGKRARSTLCSARGPSTSPSHRRPSGARGPHVSAAICLRILPDLPMLACCAPNSWCHLCASLDGSRSLESARGTRGAPSLAGLRAVNSSRCVLVCLTRHRGRQHDAFIARESSACARVDTMAVLNGAERSVTR